MLNKITTVARKVRDCSWNAVAGVLIGAGAAAGLLVGTGDLVLASSVSPVEVPATPVTLTQTETAAPETVALPAETVQAPPVTHTETVVQTERVQVPVPVEVTVPAPAQGDPAGYAEDSLPAVLVEHLAAYPNGDIVGPSTADPWANESDASGATHTGCFGVIADTSVIACPDGYVTTS